MLLCLDLCSRAKCVLVCRRWAQLCREYRDVLSLRREDRHRLHAVQRMSRGALQIANPAGAIVAICFVPLGHAAMEQVGDGSIVEVPRHNLVLCATAGAHFSAVPESWWRTTGYTGTPIANCFARSGGFGRVVKMETMRRVFRESPEQTLLVRVYARAYNVALIAVGNRQFSFNPCRSVEAPSLQTITEAGSGPSEFTAAYISTDRIYLGDAAGHLQKIILQFGYKFGQLAYTYVSRGPIQAVAVNKAESLCATASEGWLTLRKAIPRCNPDQHLWCAQADAGRAGGDAIGSVAFIGGFILAAGRSATVAVFNERGDRVRSLSAFPDGVRQIYVDATGADVWMLSRKGSLSVHFRVMDGARASKVALAEHVPELGALFNASAFAVSQDNGIYMGSGIAHMTHRDAPCLSRWGRPLPMPLGNPEYATLLKGAPV